MQRIATILAVITLTASATLAGEGDWPKWLGPEGSGISKETGLLKSWPEGGPKKLWTSDKVGRGYSSPVAADGRVFIFSTVDKNDTLTCFDAAKGDVVWSKSYDNSWTRSYPGTRSTPTIEGEFIYTYGGAGDLVCWKRADGTKVWQTNVLKQTNAGNLKWGMASSPTIVGDLIYVQSGGNGPVAVAVNKKDGKLAWKSQASGGGSYATILPIDVGGKTQLAVFAGNGIVGLDPTSGKTLWTEPWKTSYDVHATTPVYRDGYLFISSGYGTGCMMLKFDGQTPKRAWTKKQPQDRFVAAVLDGDYLYINSEGPLYCLHWPDGKEVWTSKEPGLGMGGSFVRFDDRLIAMTESGTLELLQADKDGCKVVSRVRLFSGGEHWSTPMIYQGKLYVKGHNQLVCFDISQK